MVELIHPGKELKGCMDERNLGIKDMSRITGYSYMHISDIINGNKDITARFSILVSRVIMKGSPSYFYKLQCLYNFKKAANEENLDLSDFDGL